MKLLKGFKYICEILKEKNLNDFIFLIVLFIFVSIIDIFGIASIIPFVYSIINKDVLLNNSLLNYLYNLLNFSDIDQFQIFIFFLFFIFNYFFNNFKRFNNLYPIQICFIKRIFHI